MTKEKIIEILKDVKFKDWDIIVSEETIQHKRISDKNFKYFFLHASYLEKDPEYPTELIGARTGGKILLTEKCTKSGVVKAAYKAVLEAVKRDVKVAFTYKNCRVFSDNIDVDKLAEIAPENSKSNLNNLSPAIPPFSWER